MTYKFSNNIRVFFEGKEVGSANARTAEKPKNTEQNNEQEKANTIEIADFSKKAMGRILFSKNRGDALEHIKALKKEISESGSKVQKNLLTQVSILEKWVSGNSLFNFIGSSKKIDESTKKQLAKSLNIPFDTNFELQEKIRVADQFRKNNPIEKYKEAIITECIKHPKGTEFFNKLGTELGKIETLGKDLLPEYYALIETLRKVMSTRLFDEMTGYFSKKDRTKEGNGILPKQYENNLRAFLDDVISEKKPLDINTVNATDEYISVKDMRDITFNMDKFKAEISTISDIDAKIKKLDEFRAKTNENPSKLSPKVIKKLLALLFSEKNYWLNQQRDLSGIAKNYIKGAFGYNDTSENLEKANIERLKKEKQTGIAHFAYFNKKEDKYIIISVRELSDMISKDISNMNAGLFQSILDMADWQRFFNDNFTGNAMAAIGVYIEKKPDTALFIDRPVAKSFFTEKYRIQLEGQQKIIKSKQISENDPRFEILLQGLVAKYPEISTEVQKEIKKGNLKNTYSLLVTDGNSNGKITNIMDYIDIGLKEMKEKAITEATTIAKEFKGEMLEKFKDEFNLDLPKDVEFFNKIKGRKIEHGTLSDSEKDFLLARIKNPNTNNKMYKFLQSMKVAVLASQYSAEAGEMARISRSKPATEKAKPLSGTEIQRFEKAGVVGRSFGESELNTRLSNNSKIPGIEQFNTPAKISKELLRLNGIKNKTPEDLDRIDILNERLRNIEGIATSTSNYSKIEGINAKDEIALVRDITGTKSSDKEIVEWINTQKFISTYVVEKNFVDIVEKNAAYMNMGQIKTIGDLYSNTGKIDVGTMSDNGSVSLGETNILGNESFVGINELMNCKVEVGDGVFSRTIRSPEGNIIAKNVPLNSIESTIGQLGRFYALGLGNLAPYMEQINASIGKSRTDKVTGLDGNFDISEDKKFLKILATMIYGESAIPEDANIPNLIGLFNRIGKENNPKLLLKQKGIIDDNGIVNIMRLDTDLQDASRKIV
ncbi:hypothetical protein K2X92_00300 [Candidatus Gracilibacteria bacterium]|nr:hypothetical protein [Candidatus Gracilibacteria bacterium]